MAKKFINWNGQTQCCADVRQDEAGLRLSAIGLRSEGGKVPVNASLEPEAQNFLEKAGIKPGDFIMARVNYQRNGEHWKVLQILECSKIENIDSRKSAELFFSLETTANSPSASPQ